MNELEKRLMIKWGESRNMGQQGVILCLSVIYLTWEGERQRAIKGMYDVFWPIFSHTACFVTHILPRPITHLNVILTCVWLTAFCALSRMNAQLYLEYEAFKAG